MARDWAKTLLNIKAKADGTDNAAERETFLAQMIALADQHGVDIAMLEASTKANPVRNKRIMFNNPFALAKSRLYSIIAQHFNCQVIFPRGNQKIHHLFGFQNDLSLADMLFDMLWEFGLREMEDAVKAHGVFYRQGAKREFTTSFWAAFQYKISSRLAMSRQAHLAETTGAELVLVKRSEDVQEAVTEEYPSLRIVRSSRSVRSMSGYSAGLAAGEKANLGHVLERQ